MTASPSSATPSTLSPGLLAIDRSPGGHWDPSAAQLRNCRSGLAATVRQCISVNSVGVCTSAGFAEPDENTAFGMCDQQVPSGRMATSVCDQPDGRFGRVRRECSFRLLVLRQRRNCLKLTVGSASAAGSATMRFPIAISASRTSLATALPGPTAATETRRPASSIP